MTVQHRLGGTSSTRAATTTFSRESIWKRPDWVLLGSLIGLAFVGSLLVWSATRPHLISDGGDPQSYLKRHVTNLIIGAALGAVTAVIDYRKLRFYTPIIYGLSCIGLIAVLFIGSTINGAHSWIMIGGGFALQPSEFAKVALIVGMALLLSEWRTNEDVRPGWGVPLALGLAAIPMAFILLQPDVGTAMVFAFIIVGILAIGGASWRWLVGLLLAGVLVGVAAVELHLLHDYQLDRFRAFTDPNNHSQGAAYNINQARIAIANGGLTGTGLFKGTQTNGKFVPEQQTDFIFTVAGEELGFIGAILIIVLVGIVLWRALRISGRSPDLFGRLVAVGVASWFAFQSFVNIGMALGIMPVTGLPLPFVSYGGSSMFANCIAAGLLLNVHRRNCEYGSGGLSTSHG